ncbi:MAG: hypothetical protein AB1807_06980 [Pseudomonadota bacterium]
MNLALTGFDAMTMEDRRRMQRVGFGVVLSILVHTALLTAWRSGGYPGDVPEPPRSIAVRIQPPPPPAPRIETPPPAPTPKAERSAPAKKPSTPRPVIAVPPDTSRAATPDPFVVEQPDTPAAPADTPRFDLDAAKRSARSLANLRDPAKAGTAVGQFPEKPLETETKAARLIGAAKRRDCKDGLPGGLLAPLYLLAEKKDSGCKW